MKLEFCVHPVISENLTTYLFSFLHNRLKTLRGDFGYDRLRSGQSVRGS